LPRARPPTPRFSLSHQELALPRVAMLAQVASSADPAQSVVNIRIMQYSTRDAICAGRTFYLKCLVSIRGSHITAGVADEFSLDMIPGRVYTISVLNLHLVAHLNKSNEVFFLLRHLVAP